MYELLRPGKEGQEGRKDEKTAQREDDARVGEYFSVTALETDVFSHGLRLSYELPGEQLQHLGVVFRKCHDDEVVVCL